MHQLIFHLSLKMQSSHFRKIKPDDKGRNWLTLYYTAREKPSSWEHLRRDFFGLLPTESLTASTLSEHLAVNFLPDLRLFCLLFDFVYCTRGLKFVYPTINLAFLGIIVKLNFLRKFTCTFWTILFPNKRLRNIFFLSCPRHCDQGWIFLIVRFFQIWN